MSAIKEAIRQLIDISDEELEGFLRDSEVKTFQRKEALSTPGRVPDEVFFINRGLIRLLINDHQGNEHTIHFAYPNEFIADYASFLQRTPSHQTLEALEETEVVVIPRPATEWGYSHLMHGERFGRLIAEYYFIYLDTRVKNLYSLTPKERYDRITDLFPGIHQRVPQHMIASYLGITPVHLSRLKRSSLEL